MKEKIISEIKAEAIKRGEKFGLSSPSFLDDEAWKQAVSIVHRKGPLSASEMVAFIQKHDAFAKAHLLDLVFECERLYAYIAYMAKEKPC